MLDPDYFTFWVCMICVLPVTLIIVTCLCLRTVKQISKEYLFVNKNKNYVDIFNQYCELTYESVYKDQVLAFSSSGYKLDGGALETSQRNFVKLAYELMGPNIVNILSEAYGNEETFTKNLITWFLMKLDTDEILEHARRLRDHDSDEKAFESPPSTISKE